jgi:hypothetical protein
MAHEARSRDYWYQGIGWLVFTGYTAYEASKGRLSHWVPVVGILLGVMVQYLRYRYYLPVVREAREQRVARKKSGNIPA